jgi:uncharacterized phage-associated protein
MATASAHDVAKYIISKFGVVSAMKLQKLVFYSQAWSLVWDERLLFSEKIEAWANGPVVPKLYSVHKGQFEISNWPLGKISNLDHKAKTTIDSIINFYGKKTAQELSDLSHCEKPWLEARQGLAPQERGNNVISTASLHEYYSSL